MGRRPRRRVWRRRVGLILAVLLVPVAISYGRAMLQPSNVGFGVRSVEWLREHGGAGIVNDIERAWYSINAPSKGGPALRSLPVVGRETTAGAPRAARAYRPPRVRPVVRPRIPGEGRWRSTGATVRGAPPVLVTTYRPDPVYPQLVAGLAWIDASRTRLILYPGRYEPPSTPLRGPEEVPASARSRLLAVFNSGFKLQDAHGGFVVGRRVAAPLIPGAATLVIDTRGHADVRRWTGGATPGPGILAARQNLPLIVDHARPNPNLSDGPQWGATLGNAIRVWRSGVGVDRRGNLVYAAANDQTVGSLAAILIHAGAVRAMELDINSEWVTFDFFGAPGGARAQKLLPDMHRDATRYLTPDDRDFFAVFRRAGP